MGLDIYSTEPYHILNVTHNLARMAKKCGLYDCMWGETIENCHEASDLIVPLSAGIKELEKHPEKYKELDPDNGWGNYVDLVESAKKLLHYCICHPERRITISK